MRSGYLRKKVDEQTYINILDLNEEFVLFNFSNGKRDHKVSIEGSGEDSHFEYNGVKYYIKDFERGVEDDV